MLAIFTIHYLLFTVVTCGAIPVVKDAYITSMPEYLARNKDLPVFGGVSVTYACVPGFALKNPASNVAKCEYGYAPREGAPYDDAYKVTTYWRGLTDIICHAG